MILIDNHIEHELYPHLALSNEKIDNINTKFRVLNIGEVTNYLTPEQAQELFEDMDKELHEKNETNSFLTERVETLENLVSELQEALEEENEADDHDNFDGEQDFYEKRM